MSGGAPIKTFNQSFSCMSPLVMPLDLDFRDGETYLADITNKLQTGYIDFISSVYVDMTDAAFDLILKPNVLQNQKIYCKAGSINYMPIFLSSDPKINCEITAPINSTFQILVSNIPFFPFIQQVV